MRRASGPATCALVLAATAWTAGAAELSHAEREVKNNVNRISIEAIKTTPVAREQLRREGKPVMLVEGRPSPLYWDYMGTRQLEMLQHQMQPDAPQEKDDVQGCVIVSYDVRADGKTDGFEVEQSTPPTVFDKAALRAVFATEYEPSAAPQARQRRALWFIVARPPRNEPSMLNDSIEASRNKRRDAQRAACEGQAR